MRLGAGRGGRLIGAGSEHSAARPQRARRSDAGTARPGAEVTGRDDRYQTRASSRLDGPSCPVAPTVFACPGRFLRRGAAVPSKPPAGIADDDRGPSSPGLGLARPHARTLGGLALCAPTAAQQRPDPLCSARTSSVVLSDPPGRPRAPFGRGSSARTTTGDKNAQARKRTRAHRPHSSIVKTNRWGCWAIPCLAPDRQPGGSTAQAFRDVRRITPTPAMPQSMTRPIHAAAGNGTIPSRVKAMLPEDEDVQGRVSPLFSLFYVNSWLLR